MMVVLVVVGLMLLAVVAATIARKLSARADPPAAPDLRRAGDDRNAASGPSEAAERAIGSNSWMRPTF